MLIEPVRKVSKSSGLGTTQWERRGLWLIGAVNASPKMDTTSQFDLSAAI